MTLLLAIALGAGSGAWFARSQAQSPDEVTDPFAGELHPLRRGAPDGSALPPTPTALPGLPVPFPEAATPPPLPPAADGESVAPTEAEDCLRQAVAARRRGDLEASVEWCSRGLTSRPDHPELLLRRGIAWFHLGMHRIAAEDFADAAAIAYDDPRPELWRGLTAVERGRLLEAISAYSEAIRRDRTYLLAYLNRGLAYLSFGEAQKAEHDFDHAIRHDPRDVRAWFLRGVAATHQQNFSDAARSYENALRLDPSHSPSQRNLEALRRQAVFPAEIGKGAPSSRLRRGPYPEHAVVDPP